MKKRSKKKSSKEKVEKADSSKKEKIDLTRKKRIITKNNLTKRTLARRLRSKNIN